MGPVVESIDSNALSARVVSPSMEMGGERGWVGNSPLSSSITGIGGTNSYFFARSDSLSVNGSDRKSESEVFLALGMATCVLLLPKV